MIFVLALIASVLCESIAEIVNKQTSSWVAIDYPPSIMTERKFLARLMPIHAMRRHAERSYKHKEEIAEEFDAREQWPDAILPVRDQQSCGSCWAHSIAEVVGNRLGIMGCPRGPMSPQDLVSCDAYDGGCDGGDMENAWQWVMEKGITTEACMPYVSGGGQVPVCPTVCSDESKIVRSRVQSYKMLDGDEIQENLQKFGPLSIGFMVYADFMSYKSGVYQHTTGQLEGGHAVLLVGWGVEDGVPYWLCQNSWGPEWGEQGFFKILRGVNHCDIESMVSMGYPKCM